MAIQNLNNNAEIILDIAHLLPEEKQTVTAYILNYSDPGDNCFDKIAWLAYRIWNVIKSFFGMSDWQLATSIVSGKLEENFRRPQLANLVASAILCTALDQHNLGGNANQAIEKIRQWLETSVQQGELRPLPPGPTQQLSTPLDLGAIIDATPPFANYAIAKNVDLMTLINLDELDLVPNDRRYLENSLRGHDQGTSVQHTSMRPSNLFFRALNAETSMPETGSDEPFRFLNQVALQQGILHADPDGVVSFSAHGVSGGTSIAHTSVTVRDMGALYGNNTYRISYRELQDTLASQKIHCSRLLPKQFYSALKQALLEDGHLVLPVQTENSIKMGGLTTQHCQALIREVRNNPTNYGFATAREFEKFLDYRLAQVSAMVVKTEDFRLFANGDGQIFERQPGEQDAIRLITACGIVPCSNEPILTNGLIMYETFRTIFKAGENGIILLPAIGTYAKKDIKAHWLTFLGAVEEASDGLEKICVDPRHPPQCRVDYEGRTGDEFEELLRERIASYERNSSADSARRLNNLRKIVNLYEKKTDLLQLAYNLKKAAPAKTISLFNASAPDMTLGVHVAGAMNAQNLLFDTSEEYFSMLGTRPLCTEEMTGVLQNPDRIIQAR